MNASIEPTENSIHIVGGGLAGSECAYQLAEMGHQVKLYEMREQDKPSTYTPAHKTGALAELVCSNSFGSLTDYSAPGQLKWEAAQLGSLILKSALHAYVPAGMALGIDRKIFSNFITDAIEQHPNIQLIRKKVTSLDDIPRPAVIATGPLTDTELAKSIQSHFNNEFLYFFDAIAPIIDSDSINMDTCWVGDRFDRGQGDYINCPMDKEQYYAFIKEVKNARYVEAKNFEQPNAETPYFDGCMPIEEMIRRGEETPRFGPLSPKGLQRQGPDFEKYAVVQLRKENRQGTAYNMVGFQTKMAYPEQKRIFRMIPGLEQADFLKLGSIHRNMYIHSPKKLSPILASKSDPQLFFAGQITGVEGYFESTCIGLLVSRFLNQQLKGLDVLRPPKESALGSLLNAITEEKERFQPTNINFGMLPVPDLPKNLMRNKMVKRHTMLDLAKQKFKPWSREQGIQLASFEIELMERDS